MGPGRNNPGVGEERPTGRRARDGTDGRGDGRPGALRLPGEVSESLIAEAQEAGREEACGILVGRRESGRFLVVRTVPCENVAAEGTRRRRFEIDPRRLIEEERAIRGTDEEVVGFYHSHPAGDPVPSEVDLTYMALWPDMIWVIVGATPDGDGSRVRAWRLDSLGKEKWPSEVRILPRRRSSGGRSAAKSNP